MYWREEGNVTCPDNFRVVDLQRQLPRPRFLVNDIVDSRDPDIRLGRRQLSNLILRHDGQRELVRGQELFVDHAESQSLRVSGRVWGKKTYLGEGVQHIPVPSIFVDDGYNGSYTLSSKPFGDYARDVFIARCGVCASDQQVVFARRDLIH